VEGAWKFLIGIGAGTGAVYLLRWYWWRINAWSEISAMIASFVVSVYLQTAGGYNARDPRQFAYLMLITVGLSTATWLTVTFLTRPEPEEKLLAFFRRVRPNRTFWGPVAAKAPDVTTDTDGMLNLIDWALGCVFIFLCLFGIGKLILLNYGLGLLYLAGAAVAVSIIFFNQRRRYGH
jgi:SSS family solute:Na+ symporter